MLRSLHKAARGDGHRVVPDADMDHGHRRHYKQVQGHEPWLRIRIGSIQFHGQRYSRTHGHGQTDRQGQLGRQTDIVRIKLRTAWAHRQSNNEGQINQAKNPPISERDPSRDLTCHNQAETSRPVRVFFKILRRRTSPQNCFSAEIRVTSCA